MAWTAPRLWVAGEVVTAAIMNTHVQANLIAIKPEVISASVTIGSTTGQQGGSTAVTLSGVAIGDLVLFAGTVSGTNGFLFRTEGVADVVNQITLHYFNGYAAANNFPAATCYFLVIRAAAF